MSDGWVKIPDWYKYTKLRRIVVNPNFLLEIDRNRNSTSELLKILPNLLKDLWKNKILGTPQWEIIGMGYDTCCGLLYLLIHGEDFDEVPLGSITPKYDITVRTDLGKIEWTKIRNMCLFSII